MNKTHYLLLFIIIWKCSPQKRANKVNAIYTAPGWTHYSIKRIKTMHVTATVIVRLSILGCLVEGYLI